MTTALSPQINLRDINPQHSASPVGSAAEKQTAAKRAAKIIDWCNGAGMFSVPGFPLTAVSVDSDGRGVKFSWEDPEITSPSGDHWLRVNLHVSYSSYEKRYTARMEYCGAHEIGVQYVFGLSPMAHRVALTELPGQARFGMKKFLHFLAASLSTVGADHAPTELPGLIACEHPTATMLAFFDGGKDAIAHLH